MKFIDDYSIKKKNVLLRVDFNVPLKHDGSIADDSRIRETVQTIKYLLDNKNKVIIVSHLGRPEGHDYESLSSDKSLSLERVFRKLKSYLEGYDGYFVRNFTSDSSAIREMAEGSYAVLENIRFFAGEETNDRDFAKSLAGLAEIYVNDAFAVSHRSCASVVGITEHLPSYGGLLLKKEVTSLQKVTENPKKPFTAIIGGKKISTKIKFISKLTRIADNILLSGGLANTFLAARSVNIGKSLYRKEELAQANYLTSLAKRHGTKIVLPEDAITAADPDGIKSNERLISKVGGNEMILDIGPKTQALYASIISKSKTIIWNGPMGYFENPLFKRGTDFVYYAIEQNPSAVSIIGGGDTIAAIADRDGLDKITHISTGGGAMLAFIEHGTLAGIEAIERNNKR